jgi:hypothetical protein
VPEPHRVPDTTAADPVERLALKSSDPVLLSRAFRRQSGHKTTATDALVEATFARRRTGVGSGSAMTRTELMAVPSWTESRVPPTNVARSYVIAGVLVSYPSHWIRVLHRWYGFICAAAFGLFVLLVADVLLSPFLGAEGRLGKCPRTTAVTLRNVSRTSVKVTMVSGQREGDRRLSPAPELAPGRTVTSTARPGEKYFFDILLRPVKSGVGVVKVVSVA